MTNAAAEPTLDQRRAHTALERVRRHLHASPQARTLYISYISAFPAVVLMNGLGQALAMERAAASSNRSEDDPHRWVYDDVVAWLRTAPTVPEFHGADDFLDRLLTVRQDAYLRAQAETLRYVTWLKQFARALLRPSEHPDPTAP